ncbi:Uncharacterized protein FKW44_011699, partial [Caligus rogercresseyi]
YFINSTANVHDEPSNDGVLSEKAAYLPAAPSRIPLISPGLIGSYFANFFAIKAFVFKRANLAPSFCQRFLSLLRRAQTNYGSQAG